MKIGYVINVGLGISPFSGIKIQAETWANELMRQGHQVIKVNPWIPTDWESLDFVHIIGADRAIDGLISSLSKRCRKIVFSPIIDSFQPINRYRWATKLGCKRLRMYSVNYAIREASQYIDRWFVRSHFEFEYVNKAYRVPAERISIIPLSPRISGIKGYPVKEKLCLHVSMLTDERKNVKRLLAAAVKYRFRLVLAGSKRTDKDFEPLRKIIDENDNITYLGCVSDEELINLYTRAKVFALPSIGEGVGMVAVEAALCGCDIVVTEIGGPKEYYSDMAYIVNPYSVDEIGKSVLAAMDETRFQPQLQKYIVDNYRLSFCVSKLA